MKAFEVPRNFSRKVSFVRVWGGQPQLIIHTKKRGNAAFFNYRNMLERRSKLCFKELFVKSSLKIRKNFAPNYLFVLSKAFWFPKDFSRKALWSGFGADAPTFNAHAKKHGVAVLFCFPLPYSERRAMEKSIQTKFCIVTHTEKELCDIIRSCILFLSI